MSVRRVLPFLMFVALLPAAPASAASHREAPLMALDPTADITDVYAFRSWEPGHENEVVLLMCVHPLEDPAGGPMYFPMDNDIRYEFHVDNNGDAVEDITFTFRFQNQYSPKFITTDDGTSVEMPFLHSGTIADVVDGNQGRFEPYTITVTDLRIGPSPIPLTNETQASTVFFKPLDHVGAFAIPDYDTYADRHIAIYSTFVSGLTGRAFVGQRKDPFVVNLGEVFDLATPAAEPSGNSHGGHHVTAFAIEVPIPYLTNDGANPVIGVWSTTRRPQIRTLNPSPTFAGDAVLPPNPSDPLIQTSRMGMPLVNKLLIGVSEKDRFNNTHPSSDATTFATAFMNPAIAEIMGAPSALRTDVEQFFLRGQPGVNQTGGVGDMLRLNTSTPALDPASQAPLGHLASPPDLAGFPNGRRPGDDVVDSTLRVVQGELLGGPGPFDASDGVTPDPTVFVAFPFLASPDPADRDITCVTLQSSTTPERTSFEAVEGAFVDPQRRNRIDTPLTPDPLAFYLLEADLPGSPAKIETLLLSAGRLQVLVAGSCM